MFFDKDTMVSAVNDYNDGDKEVLVYLYDSIIPLITHISDVLGSYDEDIIHDTFIDVITDILPKFNRKSASIYSWLYNSIKRKIIDKLRGDRTFTCDNEDGIYDYLRDESSEMGIVYVPRKYLCEIVRDRVGEDYIPFVHTIIDFILLGSADYRYLMSMAEGDGLNRSSARLVYWIIITNMRLCRLDEVDEERYVDREEEGLLPELRQIVGDDLFYKCCTVFSGYTLRFPVQ